MTVEPVAPAAIAAVTVSLNNTLFAESIWLEGAWRDVGAAAGAFGLDVDALLAMLAAIAAAGDNRGHTITRALAAIGVSDVDLPAIAPGLIAAFRGHAPGRLDCYPGVEAALTALRNVVPVACIADGDPHVQRAKLRALRLTDSFDAVVFSDEIGHEFRTPHPAPFERALSLLGVTAADAVHVGVRPVDDIAGAIGVGMRAVRVATAEQRAIPDDVVSAPPWLVFADPAAALTALAELAGC